MFVQHTLESAPAGSRPLISSTVEHLGHLPGAVAKLAESPEMLGGFLQASELFEASTLDPLAREVVVMTIAVRNGCQVCIAMHTGKLRKIGAGQALITALRSGSALTSAPTPAHHSSDFSDLPGTRGEEGDGEGEEHRLNGEGEEHKLDGEGEEHRLEALRQFTLRVLATAGEVPEDELEEFLTAGYTRRNALEVVLGIGTYTMSTLANRLVRA